MSKDRRYISPADVRGEILCLTVDASREEEGLECPLEQASFIRLCGRVECLDLPLDASRPLLLLTLRVLVVTGLQKAEDRDAWAFAGQLALDIVDDIAGHFRQVEAAKEGSRG